MFLYELNERQQQAFICLAHDVAVSDGDLSPAEAVMMDQLRLELQLPDDFKPHYIPIDGIENVFNTVQARVAVVINLVRLGYADGAFEIEEQFLLKEICRLFGIDETAFKRIENWVLRLISLEKEARSLM